jgi:hypothetical protein
VAIIVGPILISTKSFIEKEKKVVVGFDMPIDTISFEKMEVVIENKG